jgi:hypothetical protein
MSERFGGSSFWFKRDESGTAHFELIWSTLQDLFAYNRETFGQ